MHNFVHNSSNQTFRMVCCIVAFIILTVKARYLFCHALFSIIYLTPFTKICLLATSAFRKPTTAF